MKHCIVRAMVVGASVLGLQACSWARFDDVSDDAPVVLLSKPGGVGSGFGATLASVSLASFSEVRLLVGPAAGASGAAEYSIGNGQSPNRDAVGVGHCSADQGCSMAHSPAALRQAQTGAGLRSLCYAEGIHAVVGGAWAILLHCQDSGPADLALGDWLLPSGVTVDASVQRISLASEPGVDQSRLLAGLWSTAQTPGTAFVYRPGAITTPELLVPPAVGPSFGRGVAILRVAQTGYFALGEPDAQRVWLYRDDGTSAKLLGCVSGQPGFGASLAAGKVDAGASEDLVVADEGGVHVLSGDALAALSSSDPAQCVASESLDGSPVTLRCRNTADVSGCVGDGTFPAVSEVALAVADLDHDADGEVLVGVPSMTVRDETSAGAVLVYDVEPEHPDWLTEARFISSAKSGDRLGAAVSVVRQVDRDIYVAGAPGGGKAAVFLCSKLLPADKRGSRCK